MNVALKVTKIGNSAGIILPKDLLAHLDAEVGASLSVVKTAGGIELRVPDEEFEQQLAVAREVMASRKRALRELAK
jgi:putative addiction module antidote